MPKKKKTNTEKLSDAYINAFKKYNELRKQGFEFDKRTQKMFSAETFQQKALKPTKNNIERYKAITKSALYKKAKGFYDIDNNSMVSVSKGKKIVRQRKAEEKKQSIQKSNKNVELYQKLNNIDSKFFDIEQEKNEVLNNYADYVASGHYADSALIAKIDEKINIIIYSSKQELVNDAFDSINSMLTGGQSYSDGGNIELVGTPYENM